MAVRTVCVMVERRVECSAVHLAVRMAENSVQTTAGKLAAY